MKKDPEYKRRNPFIAFFLSFSTLGLGQIYNGQFKKGMLFSFFGFILIFSYSFFGLNFTGLVVWALIFIFFVLYVYIDSIVTSIKLKYISLAKYNKLYFYISYILGFLILIMLLKNVFGGIKAYSIPSSAMEPTLMVGDYLNINKFGYGIPNPFTHKIWIPLGKPQRGDVVVFIYPQDPDKDYIKRVIGLPGDRIQIIDKKLYVNSEITQIPPPSDDPNAPRAIYQEPEITPTERDNFGPVVVPQDAYFVMGDNRDRSFDSRFWGFVPYTNLRGKALYIYFSEDQKANRVRWNRMGKTID